VLKYALVMDQVGKVREKIDIVALISEYLTLKKAGRNFKANCPFHNEKTPSLVISPERQIWHCFGCSKGGDCFTFLMEYENLEFPEALRILAKKTGIELENDFLQKGNQSKKEKIISINEKAGKLYSYLLSKHPVGKNALNYLLEKRKIPQGLVDSFEIGFSPNMGDSLSQYLIKKKGVNKLDLSEAGLAFEARGRVNDFFRGRLMFPLKDHRGNLVGFSARLLDDSGLNTGPKYINTKDTVAYHKGELFFGLDKAKEEIKKLNQAIIVEGEFDVISCFKEGIKNVIAIKGTALTESQAILLSRFCKKVTLCLDQDEAGLEATKRSLAFLEKKDLITTIIVVPNGKDPDESIKDDPVAFKKAMKNDISVYDFLIEKIIAKNNKDVVDGKRKIADEFLPFIAQISNEVVKEHYLKRLSKEIDTSLESLQKQIEKIQTGAKAEDVTVERKSKRARREVLEEYLLALIIQQEKAKQVLETALSVLGDYVFEVSAIKKIMDQLVVYFKSFESFDQKKFANALPQELLPIFDGSFILPTSENLSLDQAKEEASKIASELAILFTRERINKISDKIKELKKSGNETGDLEKELSDLIRKLPKNI
jgi:DNA primase